MHLSVQHARVSTEVWWCLRQAHTSERPTGSHCEVISENTHGGVMNVNICTPLIHPVSFYETFHLWLGTILQSNSDESRSQRKRVSNHKLYFIVQPTGSSCMVQSTSHCVICGPTGRTAQTQLHPQIFSVEGHCRVSFLYSILHRDPAVEQAVITSSIVGSLTSDFLSELSPVCLHSVHSYTRVTSEEKDQLSSLPLIYSLGRSLIPSAWVCAYRGGWWRQPPAALNRELCDWKVTFSSVTFHASIITYHL